MFGSSLRGQEKLVECYERIHTGYGDGIMLRPAIVGNMKRYPDRRHILHIYKSIGCIFEDIKGLEIVPIMESHKISNADMRAEVRYNISADKMAGYNLSNLYRLSTPCADYESDNSPFESIAKTKRRIRFTRQREFLSSRFPKMMVTNKKYNIAVPTGNIISKSRQQIFCDTVGVPFFQDNYDVNFFKEEEEFADEFIGDSPFVVGIHMRTSTHQRDYKRMIDLVEYVSKQVHTVITFDHKWEYEGRMKNVKSSLHSIREKWAIISKLKMLIGPDSFGVHASGALGIPTYGMFGPTDPACRLSDYKNATWNRKWRLPVLRRGFRLGCGRQYCWYKSCKARPCLNARSPKFYWKDAVKQLEGVI